ncbi:MAG: YbaB/EbfC family nucleoid-associated protein [Breznakia sp.]
MDLNGLMKQAQKMQADIDKQKRELQTKKFTKSVGGGAVKIEMNGGFEVESIHLEDELLHPDNKEMLSDLVKLALNELLQTIESEKEKSMAQLSSGVDLSGLL